MTPARWLLLGVLVLVLVVAVAAAYVYGRSACPPPAWWVEVFSPSGGYACVART